MWKRRLFILLFIFYSLHISRLNSALYDFRGGGPRAGTGAAAEEGFFSAIIYLFLSILFKAQVHVQPLVAAVSLAGG